MGRTTCTEPQCLYTGALYLFTFSPSRVYKKPLRNTTEMYEYSKNLGAT